MPSGMWWNGCLSMVKIATFDLRGLIEHADLEHHHHRPQRPRHHVGAALGAELTRHRFRQILAGKLLRRALGFI